MSYIHTQLVKRSSVLEVLTVFYGVLYSTCISSETIRFDSFFLKYQLFMHIKDIPNTKHARVKVLSDELLPVDGVLLVEVLLEIWMMLMDEVLPVRLLSVEWVMSLKVLPVEGLLSVELLPLNRCCLWSCCLLTPCFPLGFCL